MPKKKVHPPRILKGGVLPSALLAGLKTAASLSERGRLNEARDVLQDLDRRYPNRAPILSELLNIAYEEKDMVRYEAVCEQLLKLTPDEPELTMALVSVYIQNFRPVLALQTLLRFLERWPNHLLAEDAARMREGLEPKMSEHLAEAGLSGPNAMEIAALSEQTQALFGRGQYREARQVALKLLALEPHYAPAQNNVSQSYFAEGDIDQAIITARSVLDFEPDNIHALSNLIHYAVISGFIEEAQEFAQDMQASGARAYEKQLKIAEALAYLGDDAGILAAYQRAEADQGQDSSVENPFLHHLAGVAALRQGEEKEARRHWKRALAINPGFDLTRENLADLSAPVGERHAPWPFPLNHWLLPSTLRDMRTYLQAAARRNEEKAVEQAASAFVSQHTELTSVIPILLDRGDPHGREFAMTLARLAKTSEMLAALCEFAFSNRGPDGMRMQALNVATEAGLVAPGQVHLWSQGEWRDVVPMNYEIYTEPDDTHTPRVEELLRTGTEALYAGRANEAEKLFTQALELEPNSPPIMNNLAAVYSQQGRVEEYRALLDQIYALDPDYLFGRANLAHVYTREGKLQEAREMLEPLLKRRRMHISECSALYGAQIELSLAEGNREAAQSWLTMWEQVDPDHPNLEIFKLRMETAPILQKLAPVAEKLKQLTKRRPR